MGDVPMPEPTEAPAREHVVGMFREAHIALGEAIRVAATGHRNGRLRRKALFAIVALALVVGVDIVTGFGIVALLFLAMTDDDIIVVSGGDDA